MKNQRIIIVGGVAGGMSAAARLRRLNEDAEIVVYEKGPYVSFANCGLPYHVSGEIPNREDLLIQTPENLKARFNLDVKPYHEVISVNSKDQIITVKHEDQTFEDSYDKLILAPGAKPFVPPIKGLDQATNAYSLRNIPDLDQIKDHIDANKIENAVVIGAGFIGLEMAENLKKLGISVTIVEMAPHVLPPFDEEMANFVEEEIINNGIKVMTGLSADEFQDQGRKVILSDGQVLPSDLTLLSVGVSPNTDFLEGSDIELGMKNGIIVDDKYQTNQANIYAVGDAIITKQQITGKGAFVSLAAPANRQGRQVADIISGIANEHRGSIGTAIVRVFSKQAGSTGLSERLAKMNGLNYKVLHVTANNHVGYFPGATPIVLKLIFNPETGQIYGAQGFGENGVDKRIDVLATAIKAGLKVPDLIELELSYAPPFGAAKDPVNMLGYAGENLMTGYSDSVQWNELTDLIDQGHVLLDVREDDELVEALAFKRGIHIPLSQLRNRLSELDKNKQYIVACASGQRSYYAERMMKQHGFKVANLDGSYVVYAMTKGEELDVPHN